MRIAPVDGSTFYWSPMTSGLAVSGVTGRGEIAGRLLVLDPVDLCVLYFLSWSGFGGEGGTSSRLPAGCRRYIRLVSLTKLWMGRLS